MDMLIDIDVMVNGEHKILSRGATVENLLTESGIMPQGIAVAVNQVIIPRSQWSGHVLSAQDKVIVIQATAGG